MIIMNIPLDVLLGETIRIRNKLPKENYNTLASRMLEVVKFYTNILADFRLSKRLV